MNNSIKKTEEFYKNQFEQARKQYSIDEYDFIRGSVWCQCGTTRPRLYEDEHVIEMHQKYIEVMRRGIPEYNKSIKQWIKEQKIEKAVPIGFGYYVTPHVFKLKEQGILKEYTVFQKMHI